MCANKGESNRSSVCEFVPNPSNFNSFALKLTLLMQMQHTHDVVISVSKYFQNLHSPIVCGKGGRDVKSMRRITMPWEKDNFAEWNAYSTKKLPPFPPTCCRFGLWEINYLNYYNCCQTSNIRTHVQVCVDHAQSRLQLPCVAVQDADQLPLQSEHLSLSILIKESVYTFENWNQYWIV